MPLLTVDSVSDAGLLLLLQEPLRNLVLQRHRDGLVYWSNARPNLGIGPIYGSRKPAVSNGVRAHGSLDAGQSSAVLGCVAVAAADPALDLVELLHLVEEVGIGSNSIALLRCWMANKLSMVRNHERPGHERSVIAIIVDKLGHLGVGIISNSLPELVLVHPGDAIFHLLLSMVPGPLGL